MAHIKSVQIAFVIVVAAVFRVQAIRFAITHVADLATQIEVFERGTQWSSKAPTPCIKDQNKCIGGFKNMVHWIHEKKGNGYNYEDVRSENIFRLSSGNLIGGESGWLPALGSNAWSDYGKKVNDHIQPSAAALGMKDFGAGLRQTISYINANPTTKISLVNTCLDKYANNTAEKDFCDKITNSHVSFEVLDTNGVDKHTIGIIGFVTPTVERLSLPGKLEFADIVSRVKQVAEAATTIKTFIAIGDGNLNTAKQILDQVPKVKLVLYGAGFANTTDMTGNYPLRYNNRFIATAGRYGSAVGKLVLEVNRSTGELTLVQGKLLENAYVNVPNSQALSAGEDLKSWTATIMNWKQDNTRYLLGYTRVNMSGGEVCWRNECHLGNLMTDAVVNCVLREFKDPFPYPVHSLWHGGAFFEDNVTALSNITEFDVHKWLPYHNNVHFVRIKGSDLRQVFTLSATGIDPSKPGVKDWRQFLQVSNGVEVYYDTKSDNPKVTRVRLVHDDSGVPQLGDMQDNILYYFAIPTYLYEGRGVYKFDRKIWEDVSFDGLDSAHIGFDDVCLKNYIVDLKQVSVGLEERIWINSNRSCTDGQEKIVYKGRKTGVTVILTMIFFAMFLAVIYVGYFYVLPRIRRAPVEYPPNQL